jgi:sulfur carrier protein ThiS
MKITLRLYATLNVYLPPESRNNETQLDLPEAATISEALGVLAVPMSLPHIFFVNGCHVLRPDLATRQLQDGDILGVFPAIGGG